MNIHTAITEQPFYVMKSASGTVLQKKKKDLMRNWKTKLCYLWLATTPLATHYSEIQFKLECTMCKCIQGQIMNNGGPRQTTREWPLEGPPPQSLWPQQGTLIRLNIDFSCSSLKASNYKCANSKSVLPSAAQTRNSTCLKIYTCIVLTLAGDQKVFSQPSQ